MLDNIQKQNMVEGSRIDREGLVQVMLDELLDRNVVGKGKTVYASNAATFSTEHTRYISRCATDVQHSRSRRHAFQR